ncbi:hypothetical protein O4G98_03825 [Zoogloeaceae bacterium G21618-S1]|nr:hypothetical protein [Zoogloeaceae bacterium G21618-S1]
MIVAISQFERLIAEMKAGHTEVKAEKLRKFSPLVHDYLHDLRPIVEYLERRKDPDYEFFRGSKSYQPMGWQLFRASRQLAVMTVNSAIRIDHNVSHIAAVFMLRQALEVKFERIIGVSLLDKWYQSPKLRHGFHYGFIKDNLSYFEFASVDFARLEQIYKWCSVLLHQAIQPFAWQLPYAFSVTEGLFDSDPVTETGHWSIHGGVRICGKAAMQNAFAEHFVRSYDHGIWCVQYGDTEAVSDVV